MKTTFISILPNKDNEEALLNALNDAGGDHQSKIYEVDTREFCDVPRTPFAYWVGDALRRIFRECKKFDSICSAAVNGAGTLNDFRFVRLWCECGLEAGQKVFAKGGTTQSYYADILTTIRWKNDGAELKQYVIQVYGGGSWSRSIRNTEYYGSPGITWPLRAARFSPSALPKGAIFSVRSYAAFPAEKDIATVIALCSSAVFDYLFKTMLGRYQHPEFICGSLLNVPVPIIEEKIRNSIDCAFRKAWSLRRKIDAQSEVSHAFTLPPLLQVSGETVEIRLIRWNEYVKGEKDKISSLKSEIDNLCLSAYGLDELVV